MNDWIPFPGPQENFCQRPEFEVLYGGAAGGGKSACLIALAARHIDKSGYRGLLLRRTFPRLSEIIDRTHELYPSHGGVWRATEKLWVFPSGAKIKLGQMQHEESKRDYWGHEYQFIGYDELTEFTATQYAYMKARCRTTDDTIPTRIRSTTNPGGPGHLWVKEHFVDVAPDGVTYKDPETKLERCFIKGTVYDNPALVESNPEYIQILESLPYIERQRFLHGDWDIFEGQVFGELSQRRHGCEPFDIPPEWERFMVIDWGFVKPFSVGWYAVDYEGVLYRYREWYGCKENLTDEGVKMVAGEVAQGILDREERGERIRIRLGDPSMWNKQPKFRKQELVGQDLQSDFAAQGCALMKADNDRLQGINQVHKRFALEIEVDDITKTVVSETPRVQIFTDHVHFWRTVPNLQASTTRMEDVDTTQEDHAYDEFRYACMFRPLRPRKVLRGAPVNSFQHEREKLKRAQRYARQYGVSLDVAYTKVR